MALTPGEIINGTQQLFFFLPIALETQILVELHQKFNKTITNLQSSLLTQDIVGLEHHRSNPNCHKETCAKKHKTNLANIPHTSTLLQFANSVTQCSNHQVGHVHINEDK